VNGDGSSSTADEPVGWPAPRVSRDGTEWHVGGRSEVAWIETSVGLEITSAIPAVFEAYATLVLPESGQDADWVEHEYAVIQLLREQAGAQPWWLGYLETGGSDVVFPEARRVGIPSENWLYVVVRAGPDQAACWREPDGGKGRLPDLMFPVDRSWLFSTLWDDDWTCLGGSRQLIDGFLKHPVLAARAREVKPGEDATPPGHTAI
jgi:hypothetical protein